MAYKLQLPSMSLDHLVFHVSQLKIVVSMNQLIAEFPRTFEGYQAPEKVLPR